MRFSARVYKGFRGSSVLEGRDNASLRIDSGPLVKPPGWTAGAPAAKAAPLPDWVRGQTSAPSSPIWQGKRLDPQPAAEPEAEGVRGVGVPWHGHDHSRCPYGTHADNDPSWRLTEQALAICSCRPAHNVFQVVMTMEGIDFDAAKLRVAEILGRDDLIIEPG